MGAFGVLVCAFGSFWAPLFKLCGFANNAYADTTLYAQADGVDDDTNSSQPRDVEFIGGPDKNDDGYAKF